MKVTWREIKSTGEVPNWLVRHLQGSPDMERVLHLEAKSTDVITFVCPKHGPYTQELRKHLLCDGESHSGCLKCATESRLEKTQERFNKRVGDLSGISDIKGSPDYHRIVSGSVGSTEEVTFCCPVHGFYRQKLYRHLQGAGCPVCAGRQRSTRAARTKRQNAPFSEEFLRDLQGSPDLEKVLRGEMKTQDFATFVCPKHGSYKQRVYDHQQGAGCPICGNIARAENAAATKRRKNPYPEWFLDDLQGSPDLDKVLKGLPVKTKVKFLCSKHGLYEQSIEDHLAGHGCPSCVQGSYRSGRERELEEWLKGKGINVECNARILKTGERRMEIDLYLPDYKVGFEINGSYYHHSGPGGKTKSYHAEKTKLALQQGIKLYHFWEQTPLGLIKSIILSKLGLLPHKVYARSCRLVYGREYEFFNHNHVDGDARAHTQISLTLNDEILCSLSVRSNNDDWEIARFAVKRGYLVVGGYQRLFSEVKKLARKRGIEKIISYCNRDLSPDPTSTIYSKMGFRFDSACPSIYWYWASRALEWKGIRYNAGAVFARQTFQRHKLQEQLGLVGSEKELTLRLGLLPVYNSGNFRYVYHL